MLSKNQIKFITNLKQKKYRNEHLLFVVEGIKGVEEMLLSDLVLYHLYTTKEVHFAAPQHKVTLITEQELKKISSLTTPNTCLAIFEQKKTQPIPENGLTVALDAVRDPGNLGTIIRLCDWFGIEHLLCSPETVDVYNPKVVQSTMGSVTRVNIVYDHLPDYLQKTPRPVYGTFMDGKNVYQQSLPKEGIIVMGNEANGISEEIERLVTERISIPRVGNIQQTESLNVATATAIVLSEFRRGYKNECFESTPAHSSDMLPPIFFRRRSLFLASQRWCP